MPVVNTDLLANYDVAVFLRPTWTPQLEKLVDVCSQKNIKTVADFDDLLFRPEFAAESPSVLAGRSGVAQIEKAFEKHLEALRIFKNITVATEKLQEHAARTTQDCRIHHLPNGLSSWWLSRHLEPDTHQDRQNHMLYMPGTRSHDHDFLGITGLLANLLDRETDLGLKLIGPVAMETRLFKPGLVERGPEWVEFDQLPSHICRARACLAPLAESVFNQCKSHIKFLESAAFGTPLLATAIPDMSQHMVDGLFFPETLEDWQTCIFKLRDPDYFRHCSETLRHYARSQLGHEHNTDALLSFYAGDQAMGSDATRRNSEATPEPYTPSLVTLDTRGKGGGQQLSSLTRKYRKLCQSPKHFFLDSNLISLIRARCTRHGQ